MQNKHKKVLRTVWVGIIIYAVSHLLLMTQSGFPINTNIMDLFPATEKNPVVEQAIDAFGKNIGQKLVFLVGHTDDKVALAAANLLYKQLLSSGAFRKISYIFEEKNQYQQLDKFFLYQNYLLADADRSILINGEVNRILENAERAIYNPSNIVSPRLLQQDPLFLLQNYLRTLPGFNTHLVLENQRLVARHTDSVFYFIDTQLNESPFAVNQQKFLMSAIQNAKASVFKDYPGVEILSSGVIRHAAAGTQSAMREVSTIGTGSLIAVLLLILLAFRSVLPLFVCLVPILAGVVIALLACTYIFDTVHLFTLVFGASLIGISVDYSFHFLSDRLLGNRSWNSDQAIKRIFAGISLGLTSSLIGYAALSITPFPGLRQIAVFSAVGLSAAYLTVIILFPIMLRSRSQVSNDWIHQLFSKWLTQVAKFKQSKYFYIVVIVLLAVILIGISKLQPNDDISNLQSLSENLHQEDVKVSSIIGNAIANQFFLIQGSTEQTLLETEEHLRQKLDNFIASNQLQSYRAVSTMTPSFRRQAENLTLLQDALLSSDNQLRNYMEGIGYIDKQISITTQGLEQYNQAYLQYTDISETKLGQSLEFLRLRKTENGYASIVVLAGVNDISAHMELANNLSGVTFINKVESISQLFKRYRTLAGILVVLSYTLIYILLILRYRFYRASAIILPPVASAMMALAVIGYLNEPFSLFNALALLLVLGIGIDYTLFFSESGKAHAVPTMVAITLSALTTISSFGFLMFSQTQAIHAFGITVFLGVGFAFLLSPLINTNIIPQQEK